MRKKKQIKDIKCNEIKYNAAVCSDLPFVGGKDYFLFLFFIYF